MKTKVKSIKWLALMLAMVFLLAGCAKSADMESMPYEMPKEEAMMEEAVVEEEMATEGASGVQADKLGDPNRKLIKRYYLNVETKEYDTLIKYIESSVAATGGYIESSNLSGTSMEGYGSRNAYYVLRVPVSDADSFIEGLEKNSHVTNKSEEVDDVTLAYVDTKSRIESLRLEQDALMDMLAEADNLETIIGLQSRLTEVRYEIESYESQIRSYDNLIEYTTITVDVLEVKRETSTNEGTFGERLKDNFADGFYNLGNGLENFVIWFAGVVPALLFMAILGLIVLAIILIISKINKRKKMKQITQNIGYTAKSVSPQNADNIKESKKEEE